MLFCVTGSCHVLRYWWSFRLLTQHCQGKNIWINILQLLGKIFIFGRWENDWSCFLSLVVMSCLQMFLCWFTLLPTITQRNAFHRDFSVTWWIWFDILDECYCFCTAKRSLWLAITLPKKQSFLVLPPGSLILGLLMGKILLAVSSCLKALNFPSPQDL